MNMATLKKKASDFIYSQGFQKYFANTSWLLVEKVFNLGVAFFVGVYVARFLGPERYGMLSFAQSITGFLTVFTSLGIKGIITRNLVRNAENKNMLLGTAFSIRILASLIGILTIYTLSPIIAEDETTQLLLIILAGTSFFESFDVIKSYFQSKVLARKIVPISIIQTLCGAIVKLILIQINAPLEWFAAVYVMEFIISAIGLVIVYRIQQESIFRWFVKLAYAKRLIKDSWPLLFSGFVVVVYMKIDQVMIKYLMNDAAVGVYAIAVKLTSIWYFVGGIICNSLMPAVIQSKEKNEEVYNQRVQQLYELMIGLGLMIAIPMTLLSYPVVSFLYGSEFIKASGVIVIHVWSLIFVFLGSASSNWLLAENLQKYKMSRTLLGAIVNITLNFLLIPQFGIEGAAIATLVSQASASYIGYLIAKDTRKVFVMQSKAFVFTTLRKNLLSK